jgi:hypothetical protein
MMSIIRVRATGNGRVVGWSELKRGQVVDANRLAGLTLTLTDVIADLCSLAESLDANYRVVTIIPNGSTTSAFDLALVGSGFEVVCSRRLVRGWFPLNPFAMEVGSNYDVVVTVNASSDAVKSKFTGMLQSKFPCHVIA